jgi:type IV fimbrial biogenesis protein FimT
MSVGWNWTRNDRATRGASVIELLSAVALLALLLGSAAPSLQAAASGLRLRDASLRLVAALERSRAAALSRGRTWTVRAATDSFTTGPLGEPGTREVLPAGVVFTATTSGGEVRFSPSGMAENATFTLGLGASTRRVVINQRGKVTCE